MIAVPCFPDRRVWLVKVYMVLIMAKIRIVDDDEGSGEVI